MRNTNKILTALGIGIAAGGILGLLLAPRKGAETREMLAKKGTQLSGTLKDGIHEGQKKFNTLKEGIKEGMNNINKKVEEVM
jgi:gas vesicle protein